MVRPLPIARAAEPSHELFADSVRACKRVAGGRVASIHRITGAVEGMMLGAAIGLGLWLGSRNAAESLRRSLGFAAAAGGVAGMPSSWRLAIGAGVLSLFVSGGVAAQSPADQYVSMSAAVERGESCGRLQAWEAVALRAQLRQQFLRFEVVDRAAISAAVLSAVAAQSCDEPAFVEYLHGLRQNLELERLPPMLALYSAFARMPEPPQVFYASQPLLDLSLAVGQIDAVFAALADHIPPATGGTWKDFLAEIDDRAAELAGVLAGTRQSTQFTPDEAAAYVIDAVQISVYWLATQR